MSEQETAIITPQGVTPGGLPYPEDTEAVMLGAQAIKALAQAIDTQPWWSFYRWTGGTLGSATDVSMSAWNLQEHNMAAGAIEANTANLGGVILPRAGLYHVMAYASFVTTFPSGVPQFSVGVLDVTSGNAIAYQSGEMATSGNQRRDYLAIGLLRVAAGDTVRAFQNNYQGISGLTYAGGTAPNRFASRFQGRWVAP